jgi:Uma2 family endonuclease
MATVEETIPPLVEGQRLTRDEFLRRWEAMPQLKRAELLGGVVSMPSPLSLPHGDADMLVALWLSHFSLATPGCKPSHNATWLMSEVDAPQPDLSLRILPEYGGKSRVERQFGAGAPELVVEICLTSADRDLGEKFDLYQSAGVQEYLMVLLHERGVRCHRLIEGGYQEISGAEDGFLKSVIFPGLWLDAQALLAEDGPRILDVLARGLRSPEHAAFVERLARQKDAPR